MERGDYQILRADDSRIKRSEFSSTVQPEMVLEMSIIVRQSTDFQNNKEFCPRCRYINSNAAVTDGWVMEIVIFRAVGEMMPRGKQRIFLHLGR